MLWGNHLTSLGSGSSSVENEGVVLDDKASFGFKSSLSDQHETLTLGNENGLCKIHLKTANSNWKQYIPIIVLGVRDKMIKIRSFLQGVANLEKSEIMTITFIIKYLLGIYYLLDTRLS